VEWRFIGRQEPGVVAALMRESKILVLPTTPDWVEASPLVVMEALACGCRIVASDSGGTRENVGPDGVLVTPGNVAQLAEALDRTLAIRDDLRDWAAIDTFLESRRLQRVAQMYLERFQTALKNRATRTRVEWLPAQ
jgi:glycosyltransferase involved in cell wall biosynthesis